MSGPAAQSAGAAAQPLRRLLLDAARQLENVAERPRMEAELLWGHVLGLTRAQLLVRDDFVPEASTVVRAAALLARRRSGEPTAYLLGRKGFWTLELEVGPAVLIPRPETELLVEWALDELAPEQSATVVDLGTGSGAVALAIAAERPRARVIAIDISADALALAQRNAARLKLDNVEFRRGDWLEGFYGGAGDGGAVDLIVANPPYVAVGDRHLPALRYEPQQALVSGTDGLDAIRRIIAQAGRHLAPGAALRLEHGAEQGAAVRELLIAAGFDAVATRRDAAGHERITGGRRP
jgi:release factor glutamine methyltransferase